jgi:hypothetical protein
MFRFNRVTDNDISLSRSATPNPAGGVRRRSPGGASTVRVRESGPGQPWIDTSWFDAEKLRNCLVFHAAVAGEDDELALVVAKQQQGALEARDLRLVRKPFVRRDRGRRVVGPVVEHVVRRAPRFKPVGAGVAGDAEDPGLEAALVSKGRAVFQDADEDVLDEVLGGGAVAGHAGEEVEKGAVVALEEDPEPGHVAPAHGTHEGLVCHNRVLS